MDPARCDTTFRSRFFAPSRRRLLGFSFASAASVLLAFAEAAGKRKKKRKCKIGCPRPHAIRVPNRCACCLVSGGECLDAGGCCSGVCAPGSPSRCVGRDAGAPCSFGAECASGVCNASRTCA